MTIKLAVVTLLATLGLSLQAATPAEEKAFVDAYKKALEAKDTKALKAFLDADGAPAEIVEFMSMMQSMGSEGKITKIELITPTKEDLAMFAEPVPGPGGKSFKLAVVPTKVLVVATENKSETGSGTSNGRLPIAEVKGKLMVAVPRAAK